MKEVRDRVRSRSTSASRHGSRGISPASGMDLMGISDPDISIPVNEEEIERKDEENTVMFTENEELVDMMTTPMGRTLLTLALYVKKNAAKTGTGHVDIEDLMHNFAEQKLKESEQINKKVEDSIRELKGDFEKFLDTNECKRFDRSLPIHPPVEFATEKTVKTTDKERLCLAKFPTQHRFNGRSNNDITEHLYQIVQAQNEINLSYKEFLSYFIKTFAGEPHKLIREGLENGYTLEEVFELLFQLYGELLTANDAELILANFKAPKHLPLELLIKDIEQFTNRSVSTFKELSDSSVQCQIYNVKGVQTLLRCLPEYSKQKATQVYELLQSRNPKEIPTLAKMRTKLMPYKASIDRDLKLNGIDRPQYESIKRLREGDSQSHGGRPSRPFSMQQRPQSAHNIRPYRTQFSSKGPFRQTPYEPKYNAYPLRGIENHGRSRIQPRRFNVHKIELPGRQKCLLCGSGTHVAADLCLKMRDNRGRLARVTISSKPCEVCEKKEGMQLFHPSDYCFNRENYLRLQAQNKIPYISQTELKKARNSMSL